MIDFHPKRCFSSSRVFYLIVLILSTGARDAMAQPVQSPAVVIHGAELQRPMSKYIYSQFIEHLGRCIHGGIWAEMLEDRKFFDPIEAEHSPWRGANPRDSVVMVEADSFVGRHTPKLVALGGKTSGIQQNGLGLEKGKRYVGYIWLKAVGSDPSVEVRLSWGTRDDGQQRVAFDSIPKNYTRFALKYTAGADTDNGRLTVMARGGECLVGTLSLMPENNVNGMRADTLALLKQLAAPLYRWPGGNFVSGYDWRDGIGPRDRRAPRKNPAWKGIEHNDFGLDEFIAFCRAVDAEPLIVVNTGFGDAYSAAQEVEYANGGVDTIGGKWRAENGHPEPYKVKWWGIGNEMYGRWQLGYMQLKQYTLKHNQVVQYMRKVDPAIKVIAVGALGHRDKWDPGEKRGWTQGMFQECSEAMDLISEHFYCGDKKDLLEHIRQIPDQIRAKAEGHRELRKKFPRLQDKDIRITMDEWNYWHRPYVYGDLGCIYTLRDALGIAAGLHEYSRNTDVIAMAHYAQTVNVIGCIKTTKTDAAFATTGLVLAMYRHHFGTIPMRVSGNFGQSDLDVVAALTADRKAITIGVVNPNRSERTLQVKCEDLRAGRVATSWVIAGSDPKLYNEPGKPARVRIEQRDISFGGNLQLAPLSANVFHIPLQ